ncbi:hypothetical protein F4802DRAFT_569427 [Xylaria palmicola]|nr:hypothetical protein F4802DRAFT_569427 [Xylaria palmicola]
METSLPQIRYTEKYLISAPTSTPAGHLSRTLWQNERPSVLQRTNTGTNANPVIEIVTAVDASACGDIGIPFDKLDSFRVTNIRGTHMVIHSEPLSQMVRDVVKFYPGQQLSGANLVIQEPYTCLMHHMTDFEDLITSEEDATTLVHARVLLEFLRPRYQQYYIPARERLLSTQPTVRFDDLWVVMKPGSLAYTDLEGYKIGCVIEKSIRLPARPGYELPERWAISFWFLQVDWSSNQIGCALHTTTVDQFDGEKPIASMPIYPIEFLDAKDQGQTNQRFIGRGRAVCELLWGDSIYMRYDGECMDCTKQTYVGHVIVSSSYGVEAAYTQHNWKFHWVSPSEVMTHDSSVPLSEIELMVNPKKDRRDILTDDNLFVLSPCLSAFRLLKNDWIPINVENVGALDTHSKIDSPIIDRSVLRMIKDLVDSQGCQDASQSSLSRLKCDGVVILLHGAPGVGKSCTIKHVAMRSGLPLLSLSVKDLDANPDKLEANLAKWFFLAKKWNAILLIDNCEVFIQKRSKDHFLLTTVFLRALELLEGTLFLTTNRVGIIDEGVLSAINLIVPLPNLDKSTRGRMWKDLARRVEEAQGINLHRSAIKFLHSSEARAVEWNGYEINHCFKIAIALATAQSKRDKEKEILVEDVHFKAAMNSAHESRQYAATRLGDRSRLAKSKRKNVAYDTTESSESESDDTESNSSMPEPHLGRTVTIQRAAVRDPPSPRPYASRRPAEEVDMLGALGSAFSSALVTMKGLPSKPTQGPVTLNSDSDLCIPTPNRVGWDDFRKVGGKELFRKTKFHALDVLEGEPLIRFHVDNQKRRKRQTFSGKVAAGQDKYAPHTLGSSKGTLPERIRVNSPAIIKAFAEIHGEALSGPFLLFRPFRSLVYYESEFREMITLQENKLKQWPVPNPQTETSDKDADDEAERRILSAELEQMRCLTSFIEDIKDKQKHITRHHCQTLPFADIPLLFGPGDTVITHDQKQAYRVTKVSCTRHRVKDHKNTTLDFWKDESKVEFENNPVFVHCVYLDYNGKSLGPVSRLFTIPRYDGQKEVTSLSVFPLRYAETDGLTERLVKRGKTFFEVAGVKHMHYTGLTITTRDEVDSQVVIDFEEAINRHPNWEPSIKPALEEAYSTKSLVFPDGADIDKDIQSFLNAQDLIDQQCVEECCANESAHYDEYVEDRRREDYIISQMNRATHGVPSVAIIPRTLRDILERDNLTDDEYLIMSYRVYGFVLRSRKWHDLDMAHVFEVAALGTGEGFDELVLPPGHGDMVKSMIRQHLRDRRLASTNRDKTDVVRGKGRGLIMLLHGVPGVGKTSTAECVADLFRRPLFQITSGDLGTTAKDVEDALEENFTLASRWNSILLIDEADVFLAERTKEDFVRNSLVAVFLRMMEYYSGVLFLTTNRVGTFDEAFTSRVHISLYYPPLDRDSTLQIFEKNWERIKTRYHKAGRVIDIKIPEITSFAIDYYESNKEGRWNGRQIRNAFQSALALAELDALGADDVLDESDHNRPIVLGRKSFDKVAEAYKGFIDYLKQVYGADFSRRARENLWRYDAFGAPRMPNSLNTRLKIVEPTMPPPPEQQWSGQSYSSHESRYTPPYYQPQNRYPEGYDRPGPRSSYPPPPPEQHQSREPRDRWDSRPDRGGLAQ